MMLAGCVDVPPLAAQDGCDLSQPDRGVRVERVDCRERIPRRGEADVVDTWVATPFFRAIVRHPQAARTLPGLGGGTLVDVALWDGRDVAYEWVPLIGGGWLSVDTVDVEPDGVVVSGTVRSLPDRVVDEGAPASVRWRFDPNEPRMYLEGAEGLWLHPHAGSVRLGPGVVTDRTLVVTDARTIRDLGGALRLDGVRTIAVSSLVEPDWLDHPTQDIDVLAPAATRLAVELDRGIVTLPMVAEHLNWRLPSSVTRIRSERTGFAASPWRTAPDRDALILGESGQVIVTMTGDVADTTVRWTHEDGRTGVATTETGLAILDVGAGVVTVEAGNARVEPWSRRTLVTPGPPAFLPASLRRPFEMSHHVPAALRWSGERDRTTRRTDTQRLQDAASAGFPVAILAPKDDVSDATIDALIRVRNGATLTSPDGWSIVAWPWDAHPRLGAHGVPSVVNRTPEDALALAFQGPTFNRFLLVDAQWLEQADPELTDPLPSAAWLTSVEDLDAWYPWLNAGIALPPVGPQTWAEVPVPNNVLAVEVERQLVRGNTVASTEGRIDLTIGGESPGGRVVRTALARGTAVIHTAGALTNAQLIEDGRVTDAWSVVNAEPHTVTVDPDTDWALIVATGEDDFAVTGPIWMGATAPP
ncbi:MAG: hypothetical protein ACI855_005253 [Myxococcota bacterium]|jgi:hypothetical protein